MMNIGRVAQGGRNWEGFGADPFLVSVAAHETDHPRYVVCMRADLCNGLYQQGRSGLSMRAY
ncbi:hypothetical protein BC826DRAFT_1067834, partial [Russula brevipes]